MGSCHITTPAPNGKPTVLYLDGLQLTYGEQVKPFTEREELNLGFETPANHPEDHMYVRTEITTPIRACRQSTFQCAGCGFASVGSAGCLSADGRERRHSISRRALASKL
jgi:hypothetical protein